MKRIMSIQDLSCLGKCSLSVALPIISAMGIETSIVPTAVLSAHTQFDGFHIRDLTEDMKKVKEHWKKEDFKFDGIYTGYLASPKQIDIVIEYIEAFSRPNNLVIVDPVMAEDGKLYTGFDDSHPSHMARLCGKADIIIPNISEAALLLGINYPGEDCSMNKIKEMLLGLSKLGAKCCVITGVHFENDRLGFVGYNSLTKEFFDGSTEEVKYRSNGTGDVFASTFTGAVLNDYSIKDALMLAAEFTCRCIDDTAKDPNHRTYAVNFETQIPWLCEKLKKNI